MTEAAYTLVFDVGKTHVKVVVLDAGFQAVYSRETVNRVLDGNPYPHYDIDGIWNWLLQQIAETAAQFPLSAVTVTTHGATAALVDRHAGDSGLVLPVLDYEYGDIENCNREYNAMRPSFFESCSPNLPAGLNLGRQLYWLQQRFGAAFSKVTDILLYPQYWAWRLTGRLCSEVTSLGCHTDLWAPRDGTFSSLVERNGWSEKFPPIVPAWTDLGSATPSVRLQTGLPETCRVFAGVHDSNASFLRYINERDIKPYTVVTTGTWCVVMASGVSADSLEPERDTLANVDINGRPVACSRFMGGREYEIICRNTGAAVDDGYDRSALQSIIDSGVIALPDFSGGSGPLPWNRGRILGAVPDGGGSALASLYCALMLDYQMDLIDAEGDIYIEDAFLKNPLLCGLVAQLRDKQTVWRSSDASGTVTGCALMAHWPRPDFSPELTPCEPTGLDGLDEYKALWRNDAESGALRRRS